MSVFLWILKSRLGRAVGAVGAAVLFILTFGAVNRRWGRQDERQRAKEADNERAKDIRNRVERDHADRMRGHDDSGWRD